MKKVIYNPYTIKNIFISNLLIIIVFVLFSSFSYQIDKDSSKEKIYIQFDKPNYYAGENIWFKTYLLNAATHKPETLSKIVYAELISPNNKIIETKTIKISDGGGDGYFQLSPNLDSGEYIVRAYTNYMRNFNSAYFFRKKIHIKALKDKNIPDTPANSNTVIAQKPDLQFFPEGGYLVNGFANRVGFKAVDINGKGIDVEGVITDNTGKKILELKTSKFGMGMFKLTPKPNSSYKLNIVHKGFELTYEIPAAIKHGVAMQIMEHSEDFVATLQSSLSNGLNNFSFYGKQRDRIVFKAKLTSNKNLAIIKVPKNVLTQGIVQFTLVDDTKKPLTERLSFYENEDENLKVDITPTKQEYGTRELVKLNINLDSLIEEEINTNMSISVTDLSAIEPDQFGLDIKSQLLLNSELKGTIEKPGYYFNSDDPERKRNLDILLMTQGWRKFIINDTLKNPLKPTYATETGISFSGQVKNFNNHKKSAIAEVSLTYKNSEEFAHENATTDANGHFAFKNLNFLDSTSVIVQAKKINIKKSKRVKIPNMNFHIEMDSFIAPNITLKQKQHLGEFSKQTKSISQNYLRPLLKLQEGTIILDEVVVEKDISEIERYYSKKRGLVKNPSYTIDFKDIKGLPYDDWLTGLVGRVPGYSADGTLRGSIRRKDKDEFGNEVILGLPLYLLDGTPMSAKDIKEISYLDIDFIDIIHSSRAAIYGSRGGNGVIAIYTFDGTKKPTIKKDTKRRGILNFKHPGYGQAKKFYEPVYKIEKQEEVKPDYRSTIYWKPTIELDADNKTSVSFYTSDAISPYKIVLEGITLDGEIIHFETNLNLVKDLENK